MRINGLILAGGEGRRMGGADKALLILNGRTLLDHAVARLGPQLGALALSANGDPARFAGFSGPVLADETSERYGPMAGVLAGLDWAAEVGADALVTVSVDTPFLPTDMAARLAAANAGGLAVAESGGRLHPTCALWPVQLRPALRAALEAGERRIGQWVETQGAVRVRFAGEPDPFININTPGDLAWAEAAARRQN